MRAARAGGAALALTCLGMTAPVAAASEDAQPSCSYSPATHELVVDAGPDVAITAVRRVGDAVAVINQSTSPETVTACTGGTATVANTDTVRFVAPKYFEPYRVELSGGPLAPGKTNEGDGSSEIEVAADRDAPVFLVGTDSPEHWRFQGSAVGDGVNLNPSASDSDLDVYGPPTAHAEFAQIEMDLAGGNDWIEISGRPLTAVRASGGSGNDAMSGGPEVTGLFAGSGNDLVRGGGGRDWLSDGSGADRLAGGAAGDLLYMNRDHVRDQALCGKGRDIAVQRKATNKVRSCEKRLRRYVDPFTFFSPGFPGPLKG
jgi:hypothetical protein